MSWLRKKNKVNKNPTVFDIFEKFVPLVASFKGVMLGTNALKNQPRTDEYLEQLNDFCLHPLREEIDATSSWFDGDFSTQWPHLETLCFCLYKPLVDTLTEYEKKKFKDTFYMGLPHKYDCYMLLFLLRRVMVLPKYRHVILSGGYGNIPPEPIAPEYRVTKDCPEPEKV